MLKYTKLNKEILFYKFITINSKANINNTKRERLKKPFSSITLCNLYKSYSLINFVIKAATNKQAAPIKNEYS